MSEFKIQMPKLGESVQEATITKWFVKEGDRIEEDDMLFEVASDKVDSEIPSPVEGVVKKIFHPEDALVPVDEIVAIISIDDGDDDDSGTEEKTKKTTALAIESEDSNKKDKKTVAEKATGEEKSTPNSGRFYSPLVMSIAKAENVNFEELESIPGSGQNGRVQKNDILKYLENRKSETKAAPVVKGSKPSAPAVSQKS